MQKLEFLNLEPKMPYFDDLGSNFEKPYPEFALFPSLVQKVKILKFGTKNAWFPYFETGIWKYCCHNWNQHPRISLVVMFGPKKKSLNLEKNCLYVAIFGMEFGNNIVIF